MLSDAGPHRRVAFIALGCALAAFALIAVLALSGAPPHLDSAVNEAVAASRTATLTTFFQRYTGMGRWFVVTAAGVAAVAGLAAASRPRAAAFLAVAVATALLLNPLLKVLFERERPPAGNAVLQVGGLAFPSGHSLASATLALAILVVAWPTRWRWPISLVVVTFAALMGLSRVYLGVHWVTDVLGAWALAAAIVAGTALVLPASTRPTAEPAAGPREAA